MATPTSSEAFVTKNYTKPHATSPDTYYMEVIHPMAEEGGVDTNTVVQLGTADEARRALEAIRAACSTGLERIDIYEKVRLA